jgi:hypothetical protein
MFVGGEELVMVITTMTAPGDLEDRKLYRCIAYSFNLPLALRDGHDHDRMVVGFTTTYAISNMSSNPIHGKVYLIQHYVIKVVSDLLQVGDFLRVLWFPPRIKLTATI